MVRVETANGRVVYATLQPDADFDNYGYYYEVFADENGDQRIDWGNTYEPVRDFDVALDWLIGVLEETAY